MGMCCKKKTLIWVKKFMEYEVEVSRPRSKPKRTWREILRKDFQACKWNREAAMDRIIWNKLIKVGR